MGTFDKRTMIFNCNVLKWVDGDTVDLDVDMGFSIWSKQRIRLSGIDTPEKGEENYTEATNKAKEIAPIGIAAVLFSHGKDKYGRYIGELKVNNVIVNEALIESGLAKPYKE